MSECERRQLAGVCIFMSSLSMQKRNTLFERLKKNRRQLALMASLLIAGILTVVLWPQSSCSEVFTKMEHTKGIIQQDDVVLRLDSLAFGAHCDTFSLVFKNKLWVLSRCKEASKQLLDSLEWRGLSEYLGNWMEEHQVGTIVYHYPNLSFEYASRLNSDYNYRLQFNRDPLILAEKSAWMTCEQAEKSNPNKFYIPLDEHWYLSALKK